jgi:hypothetical protein
VIREQVREGRDSVGRKLIDVLGYTFRGLCHQLPRPADSGNLRSLTEGTSVNRRVVRKRRQESPPLGRTEFPPPGNVYIALW